MIARKNLKKSFGLRVASKIPRLTDLSLDAWAININLNASSYRRAKANVGSVNLVHSNYFCCIFFSFFIIIYNK